VDGPGDATAVWPRNNGTNDIIQAAGFDAVPPKLSGISIPGQAIVGQLVGMSATASDFWPIGPPVFHFGDGGVGGGNTVSHTYAKPGSYPVQVVAEDAAGTRTTETRSILVKARNFFTIGKLKRNKKKGTATLEVTVPEPGSLTLTGKGLQKSTASSAHGGSLRLSVKAKGKGKKHLNRSGKLKAKLRVTYAPDGGDRNSATKRATLLKRVR
jgi:hypothetical protein